MSLLIIFQFGLFFDKVFTQFSSNSHSNLFSKPAISNPSANPPQPANNSTEYICFLSALILELSTIFFSSNIFSEILFSSIFKFILEIPTICLSSNILSSNILSEILFSSIFNFTLYALYINS